MTIKSTFVETPYGRFHVEAAGQGKPVLFIHGGTASAREWRWVLPGLGKHARCVAVDRLGCGESDRSRSGYDRATLTKSLLACADSLGFERFGLVGQSFGGFWSISLASAAPDRISRLVIVNSGSGSSDLLTEEERQAQKARLEAAPRNSRAWSQLSPEERETSLDRLITSIFADPSRVPASYREDLRWQMERADPAQTGAAGPGSSGITREDLARIKCPTLVVFGEEDTMGSRDGGRRLAATIPGARYVGLLGLGHTCQIEGPDEFIAAVAPFIDETNPSA